MVIPRGSTRRRVSSLSRSAFASLRSTSNRVVSNAATSTSGVHPSGFGTAPFAAKPSRQSLELFMRCRQLLVERPKVAEHP
jgi:hypothetical protein